MKLYELAFPVNILALFLAKPGRCPKPWKGQDGICDYRGDMCRQDSDCTGDDRCCFNGCQNDCVAPGIWNKITTRGLLHVLTKHTPPRHYTSRLGLITP